MSRQAKAQNESLTHLDDDALCRLGDELSHRVWTCRRRGWNRKLEQVRTTLGQVCTELGERIERERAAAK